MAEVRNPTEPSMEEILASIQRIIVDDEQPLPRAFPDPGELTTDAAAPPPVPGIDASPSGSSPEQDLSRQLDAADAMRREPVLVSPAPWSPSDHGRSERPPDPKDAADTEPRTPGLAASVAALTRIASTGQAGRSPELPLGDVGRTLEDMVRELLRPQLKEWLDAHLPQLVERLVRDEIARLLREAQQR